MNVWKFATAKKLVRCEEENPAPEEGKVRIRVTKLMLNGTDRPQTLDLKPYAEILPRKEATDFLSGQTRQLTDKLELKARDVLLLEF